MFLAVIANAVRGKKVGAAAIGDEYAATGDWYAIIWLMNFMYVVLDAGKR